MLRIILFCFLLINFYAKAQTQNPCLSQQDFTIVVIGSSTAAGTGPSSADSAWVNRYREYLQHLNPNNQVINLARGGYTTYHSMPSNFVSPVGRPNPDLERNIDAALANNPDAIIINYPSNDTSNGIGIDEQMSNFDSMSNYAANFNVPVWVCTTQPKTSFDMSQDDIQIGVRDSIFIHFGDKAVDFWTTIATSDNNIDPLYDADGTHLNNAGHAILESRIIDANIPLEIYSAVNSSDYQAIDLTIENGWDCVGQGDVVSFAIANIGIEDTIGFTALLTVTNWNNGVDSIYSQGFINGLGACERDTLFFAPEFYNGGIISMVAQIVHTDDGNVVIDSFIVSAKIDVQPVVAAENDIICEGENVLLLANSSNADTVFWYADNAGANLIHSGNEFTIEDLSNDSTVYVQAVSGPLVFLDEVSTNYNSDVDWNGVMFDIVAHEDILIDSLSCRMDSIGSHEVQLYFCLGSHLGNETNPSEWSLWNTETVEVNVSGELVMLHPSSIELLSTDTLGIYIMMGNPEVDVSYTRAEEIQFFQSESIEVISGSGSNHNFGGPYFPRIWNGSIHTHHGFNPQGSCASAVIPVNVEISIPNLFLGNDTIITTLDTLRLSANGFEQYVWSSNDTTNFYEIIGNDLGIGAHIISLEVVNEFGCSTIDSIEITIIEPSGIQNFTSPNIQLFPNPSSNILTVLCEKEILNIELYDTRGRLIKRIEVFSNQTAISIDDFHNGVYFIVVATKQEKLRSKFLKVD